MIPRRSSSHNRSQKAGNRIEYESNDSKNKQKYDFVHDEINFYFDILAENFCSRDDEGQLVLKEG